MTTLWAVLTALPFGWSFGLLVAGSMTRGDAGQAPALTIPIAIIAAVIFALMPVGRAGIRLRALLIGTALCSALDAVMPY